MIRVYTHRQAGNRWIQRYRGSQPAFVCVLGFTETALIPGISAAGATPKDRQTTAVADAEFLYHGPQLSPYYPLPPLTAGASPVLISRAVVSALNLPLYLFNAGLPQQPSVPVIDLGGTPARCLTTGQALELTTVKHLLQQGLHWGEQLAKQHPYLVIGECVVGGTTTALAILTGLGIAAAGKVNSSHPQCNHAQKWQIVQIGLQQAGGFLSTPLADVDPLQLLAAVGDPVQVVVAGMAIAASRQGGVLLAGGTQMLAIYALIEAMTGSYTIEAVTDEIVIGTTRWVAQDSTGDTIGLANDIGSVSFMATQLSFAKAHFQQLQAYEKGFVKEGMGAGGCAIVAYLYKDWSQTQLLEAIETLLRELLKISP